MRVDGGGHRSGPSPRTPAPSPREGLPLRLDIVLPAHDEADRIGPVLSAYRRGIPDADVRFLVAMDGCTDDTAAVVASHAHQDDRVVALPFPRMGKGGVLAEAFRLADAELVGFVDADGATPPSEFLRLVDATAGADGAIASRRHHAAILPGARPAGRRVASAGFATVVRGLFHLPYADTQCGAKVFRRAALDRALPHLASQGFLFDVDLLYVMARQGFHVVEVPTVWTDRAGSKLALRRDARRMGLAAVALWLQRLATPVPGADEPADAPTRENSRAAA